MRLRSLNTVLGLACVFALFAVSFAQPAIFFRQVSTNGPKDALVPVGYVTKTGTQMALGGLFGPFFGNFAVFANPLLILGSVLLLLKRARGAMLCFAIAALFALQTFQLMVSPFREDEGGVVVSYMVHPLAGWYCWFGAILLALGLAVMQHRSGMPLDRSKAGTALDDTAVMDSRV